MRSNTTAIACRNGHDWTFRFPLIVEAALRNRIKSFVLGGEAVIRGVDGISDFNALQSRQHDREVELYAFDILALEGDDLRRLPLHLRKTNLARLLARRPDGIFLEDFERGEIGPDLFRQACKFGLEGLVSKHKDRLPRRHLRTLDQGQEPRAPGNAEGKGGVLRTESSGAALNDRLVAWNEWRGFELIAPARF